MSKYIILTLSVLFQLARCQEPNSSLDTLINDIFKTDQNAFTTTTPKSTNLQDRGDGTFQPTPTHTTILNSTNSQEERYKSCGFQKECVPRFLCNNDSINTNGENIIDIRIDNESECKYLEVCCNVADKRDKPVITIPVTHEGCGYQNPNGVGFKITGAQNNEAEFGEFPWMVAILREESTSGDILNLYECGGALIAPNVVLTATHCVRNKVPTTLIVRAGEWDTQTKSEALPHQDRYVKEIVVHENYNKGALYNDVALLFLESSFMLDENVQPVCLPEENAIFDFSRCYATGWGKDRFGKEGNYQVILKKIDLPVVPRDQCQQNLRTTRLGKYFNLDQSFICAGGEKGKDTCKGDGGSPLVCPIPGTKDRYFQAGIVAWGIGCGEENVPGVYANVPYLRSWINEKLTARNIDFSYFTPKI